MMNRNKIIAVFASLAVLGLIVTLSVLTVSNDGSYFLGSTSFGEYSNQLGKFIKR